MTGPDIATGPGRGKVVVTIAAYNEEATITGVVEALPRQLAGLAVEVVVVDDGSADATAAAATKAGAVVVEHGRNRGQGAALRSGFAEAYQLGATVVVTMDADGQHDPADLPALVAPVAAGTADYVQGSRFLGRYDDEGGARDAGIRLLTRAVNRAGRLHITDCANGFRAIRATTLRSLTLTEDQFSAAELLLEVGGRGYRVQEVPVHIRRREIGESRKPKRLRYPLGYLRVVMRVGWRVRRAAPGTARRPRRP